ncbi:MAG: hypothetical protein WCH76_08350 [Candidatus Riflemargulisbacteria bacterium]
MKVKRLSHKKIQIEQTLPILCNGNKLGEVSLYQRYRLEIGQKTAYLIHSERIINRISQQYQIKKKFISFNHSPNFIDLDGENISLRIVNTIVFSDLIWYRDFKIKQIIS